MDKITQKDFEVLLQVMAEKTPCLDDRQKYIEEFVRSLRGMVSSEFEVQLMRAAHDLALKK